MCICNFFPALLFRHTVLKIAFYICWWMTYIFSSLPKFLFSDFCQSHGGFFWRGLFLQEESKRTHWETVTQHAMLLALCVTNPKALISLLTNVLSLNLITSWHPMTLSNFLSSSCCVWVPILTIALSAHHKWIQTDCHSSMANLSFLFTFQI